MFVEWAPCWRSSSFATLLTKEPAPDLTERVIDEALQRGLLLLKAGVDGNCIRVLCPLTTSDAELDDGLGAWEDSLAAVLG